ncbi:hypothetical protein CBA19CS11_33585 [Caballeronia novacaledonica]|uniref:hypothetical protein n=1 Tax=Caballeronia novacaledonica TaxID=1544861 RepID=UPI001EE21AA8|nr:hypothetical protein [Caballeronia novacaledonica]GJH13877.1 hypothetical protein CBA19CS11_33585 [Caballeronia novacaledonica]
MNRPEYSLSLDSVICKRCNTVSPAEEDTCPSCGADRQGAIFTSRAETRAPVPVPAQLDIVDWDDSHWLQRLVRRRMLTSYPNFIEPGDAQEQRRKSAHTTIAVLVSGVVASIAVGGYFYARLDDNTPPVSDDPGISVAGSVRDRASGAPGADVARHASLMRSKADSASAQAGTPASASAAAIAKANHAREEHAVASPSVPVAARATTEAPSVAPRVEPRVVVAASTPASASTLATAAPVKPPSAPVVARATTEAPPVAPRIEPRVVVATSAPASASTLAAAAPAKPPMPAAPVAHVTANPPSPGIASSAAVVVAKPATPNTTTSAPVAAAAPSIKPATPVIASVQKPEPRVSTTLTAAAPIPAKPATQTPTPVARTTEPPRSAPTIAAAEKPATHPAPPVADPLPAAVARSIASLQQALANRDLTTARRHMRGLYASEPRSPEIQQLAAELSRQERARDGAMASARNCVANMDAACALRNARRAVSLDPRNGQTQATLRRALAVQNETNTEYFRQASGIPKPIVPTMTFDGRWTAGSRHPAMSGDDDDSRFTLFGLGVPVTSKGRGDAH